MIDTQGSSPAEQDRAEAQRLMLRGQAAIEAGEYRASVALLNQAAALATPLTALHGEIQIWLVTAYQAQGDPGRAIEVCTNLKNHPDAGVKDQAKQLLCILEAPRLATKAEWVVEIPDLAALEDADTTQQWSRNGGASTKQPPEPEPWIPEPPDPEQVNLQEEPFFWMAIAALLLVGLSLIGLA
ncbi:MAG: hypothetical protein HC824_21975 [Synechococcales cyanobacterium RM1_1_8]|nr:hypothetical protein [Synechococcales cyanobacterium RM1_1_8]